MKLLIKWLICVGALFVAWQLFPANVFVWNGFTTIAAAGTVLWLVNILLRPVVQIVSIPLTIITLGIFSIIVNAAMVSLTSAIIPGFKIHGFWVCILIALFISVVNCILVPKHCEK